MLYVFNWDVFVICGLGIYKLGQKATRKIGKSNLTVRQFKFWTKSMWKYFISTDYRVV